MYTIKENLRPIAQKFDDWTNGFYLSGLLKFKGQQQIGADYISKVYRAQKYQINAKYENALIATQNPTFSGFLSDNWFRIVALNCVQRLITACQTASSMPERFARPNTTSFLFTQIMNDGAFRGTLRGLSVSFLQASLVLWPSVLIANKTKGGYSQFLASYIILDALLHPLDTIKTIMYANTVHPKGIRQAASLTGLISSYRGMLPKLLFNIPFASALYMTAQGNELQQACWLATFACYPLLAIKSTQQAATKAGGNFRGFVPFLLLNYLFAWQLAPLFSSQKLNHIKKECVQQCQQKLGYH